MSVMELDPPDYWLMEDPRHEVFPIRTWRIWTVGPLHLPDGQQVLLCRINPAWFWYGKGEQDFVVLRPVHRARRLEPVRHGGTAVQVCYYTGRYRGQDTVAEAELVPADTATWLALADEDFAYRTISYVNAHYGAPEWAIDRPDKPLRWSRAGLLLVIGYLIWLLHAR